MSKPAVMCIIHIYKFSNIIYTNGTKVTGRLLPLVSPALSLLFFYSIACLAQLLHPCTGNTGTKTATSLSGNECSARLKSLSRGSVFATPTHISGQSMHALLIDKIQVADSKLVAHPSGLHHSAWDRSEGRPAL